MPSGGTLTFRARGGTPGRVEVEVADTGPGIAPAMLPRLFTPFGLNATLITLSVGPVSGDPMGCPVRTSHNRTLLS